MKSSLKKHAFNKLMHTFAFNNMRQDICRHGITSTDHRNSLVHYTLTITAKKFNSFLCCLAESPFARRILQKSLTNMYSLLQSLPFIKCTAIVHLMKGN